MFILPQLKNKNNLIAKTVKKFSNPIKMMLKEAVMLREKYRLFS